MFVVTQRSGRDAGRSVASWPQIHCCAGSRLRSGFDPPRQGVTPSERTVWLSVARLSMQYCTPALALTRREVIVTRVPRVPLLDELPRFTSKLIWPNSRIQYHSRIGV